MSLIDTLPILGFAKGISTASAATDAATILVPLSGTAGFIVDSVVVYNATGNVATATLGVFTGAGGTGVTIVADALLTGVAGPTDVSARTVAATATTPKVVASNLFVRIGTAVAGQTVDVVIYGRKLP